MWYYVLGDSGLLRFSTQWQAVFLMHKKVKTIRLCVNCRNLQVTAEGQEIEGLEETAFIETKCDIFGHTMKELYQFPCEQGPLILDGIGSTDCPFWEPWDLSQKVLEPREVEREGIDPKP